MQRAVRSCYGSYCLGDIDSDSCYTQKKAFNMYIYKENLKREINDTIFKPLDKKINEQRKLNSSKAPKKKIRENNQEAWKTGKDKMA